MMTQSISPGAWAFLEMLSKSEGTSTSPDTQDRGYDVIVSGIDGRHRCTDYDAHPFEHGRAPIAVNHSGLKSTASGRYQIRLETWREVAAHLGLKDFTPASQDAAAQELIRRRRALSVLESGNVTAAIELCREEWASLPGGDSGQPEHAMQECLAWYATAMQGAVGSARAVAISVLAIVLSIASAAFAGQHTVALPNHSMTPGEADPALTQEKLCDPNFHTGTVRNVPQSQKVRVCSAYGIVKGCPGRRYELDHLISIELGGANSDANLWPQPADAPGMIGFHTKDVVENRLHHLVCSGALSLSDAQDCIAGDWYACGEKWHILPDPK